MISNSLQPCVLYLRTLLQNYYNATDTRVHACARVSGNESSPDASRVLKFNPPVRPIEFNRPIELKIQDSRCHRELSQGILNLGS